MRGCVGSRVAAAIAGSVLLLAAAAALVPEAAAGTPTLRHAGRWMTDSRGRTVVLHGVAIMDFGPKHLPAVQGFSSDDAAFRQKDIPTVGLYTGASGPKSEAHAGVFGGVAGRPYDPCYHQACDTTDNISREVLEQSTRALVRALTVVTVAAQAPGASIQKAADAPESKL